MKILFLTVNHDDYLSDCILHGLRELVNDSVVDFPKKESLYKTYPYNENSIYGKGFTLYKTLEDIDIDRRNIREKINNNYFDLYIFSDISEQFGFYLTYYNTIKEDKIIALDGNDSPKIHPYFGRYWRKFPFAFLPSFHKHSIMFKREWTPLTLKYRSFLLFPEFLSKMMYHKMNLHKISFCIPEEKIIKLIPIKQKEFGKHIVDQEVIEGLKYGSYSYVFENEADYYYDIQISKYCITTKRAGWDCMRHYEIAANGSVPCFRGLDLKSEMCAPHGLIDGFNCISYSNFDELKNKIKSINELTYLSMQKNAINWVRTKSTKSIARYLISTVNKTNNEKEEI